MSQNGTCTHIKVTGVRCGSPALHGEEFCYFHQNAHRTVRRPKQSRLHPIALIEDEESIQYSLMEVINALMRNTIDLKRAALILRALHIAVKNATRVKYNIHSKDMVTNIPKYAEPPTEEDFGQTSETELPAVAANPNLPVSLEGPHYWEMQAEAARRVARDESLRFAAEAKSREEARRRFAEERAQEARAREEWNQAVATTTHVGTAAIGCPAKPQASASVGADAFVRPAPSSEARGRVPAAETTTKPTPAELPSHTFNHPSQPPPAQSRPASRGVPSNSAPPRKQPQSVFHAPKGRKNGAHSARRG